MRCLSLAIGSLFFVSVWNWFFLKGMYISPCCYIHEGWKGVYFVLVPNLFIYAFGLNDSGLTLTYASCFLFLEYGVGISYFSCY